MKVTVVANLQGNAPSVEIAGFPVLNLEALLQPRVIHEADEVDVRMSMVSAITLHNMLSEQLTKYIVAYNTKLDEDKLLREIADYKQHLAERAKIMFEEDEDITKYAKPKNYGTMDT